MQDEDRHPEDAYVQQSWDQGRIQSYIDNKVEEGPELDYKASDALAKTDGKRLEITKDVSALANSAGGSLLYGIREYSDESLAHLPEAIDPISRSEFPKEWLEHVINSIRPRIRGVNIHSISISSHSNHVVYAVEIHQSTTAHQAKDYRYYRRFNFESVPMYDHEIRDVMNRSEMPDLEVEVFHIDESIQSHLHQYRLGIVVRNVGSKLVEDFKLVLTFPTYGDYINWRKLSNYSHPYFGLISHSKLQSNDHSFVFRSRYKLFPEDQIDVGEQLQISYEIDDVAYDRIGTMSQVQPLSLTWKLYADDMPPESGEVLFSSLNIY